MHWIGAEGSAEIKESSTVTVPLKHRSKSRWKLIKYYTFGKYDVVIMIEATNDEAVMSMMLEVGSAGM